MPESRRVGSTGCVLQYNNSKGGSDLQDIPVAQSMHAFVHEYSCLGPLQPSSASHRLTTLEAVLR